MSSRGGTQGTAVQLGMLGDGGADQQAAVGSSADAQLSRGGPPVVDQPAGCGVKIVEDVLFVVQHPGSVPALTFLGAASQVGDRVNPPAWTQARADGLKAGASGTTAKPPYP